MVPLAADGKCRPVTHHNSSKANIQTEKIKKKTASKGGLIDLKAND